MKHSLSHVFEMRNDFDPDRIADGHKISINNSLNVTVSFICLFYLFDLSSGNTQKSNFN